MHTLHYNARVWTQDQQSAKLGYLANNAIPAPIAFLHTMTKQVEFHPLVATSTGYPVETFSIIQTTGGKSGRRHVSLTPDSVLYTPSGPAPLDALHPGAIVLAGEADYAFCGQALQVLLGSALGDASTRLSKAKHRGTIRFGHGHKQGDYIAWKYAFLREAAGSLVQRKNGTFSFNVKTSSFGALLDSWIRIPHKRPRSKIVTRQAHPHLIAQLTPLAFAVWYMDDGTFQGHYEKWGNGRCSIAATATDEQSLHQLAKKLCCLGGVMPRVSQKGLHFDSCATAQFHALIAPYVPPCMAYKIHPRNRGQYRKPLSPDNTQGSDIIPIISAQEARILSITPKPKTRGMMGFHIHSPIHLRPLVDGVAI